MTPTPDGSRCIDDRVGDLIRHPLLHLQPPRETVDEPRELGEPDDARDRQVPDRRAAVEGQHVMLARRIELDVAEDDHLVALFRERRREDLRGLLRVSGGHLAQRADDAPGVAVQAVALWILADEPQELPDASAIIRSRWSASDVDTRASRARRRRKVVESTSTDVQQLVRLQSTVAIRGFSFTSRMHHSTSSRAKEPSGCAAGEIRLIRRRSRSSAESVARRGARTSPRARCAA
jgi:hypothetical protein